MSKSVFFSHVPLLQSVVRGVLPGMSSSARVSSNLQGRCHDGTIGGRGPFEVDSFHATPIGIMLNAEKFAGDRSPGAAAHANLAGVRLREDQTCKVSGADRIKRQTTASAKGDWVT